MTEKMQASVRQRREPLIVRCCLKFADFLKIFYYLLLTNIYRSAILDISKFDISQ